MNSVYMWIVILINLILIISTALSIYKFRNYKLVAILIIAYVIVTVFNHYVNSGMYTFP